jgi:hypothetical protein
MDVDVRAVDGIADEDTIKASAKRIARKEIAPVSWAWRNPPLKRPSSSEPYVERWMEKMRRNGYEVA